MKKDSLRLNKYWLANAVWAIHSNGVVKLYTIMHEREGPHYESKVSTRLDFEKPELNHYNTIYGGGEDYPDGYWPKLVEFRAVYGTTDLGMGTCVCVCMCLCDGG
jgi:hypothetical protein